MEDRLLIIARRFWPKLETMSGPDRTSGVFDVVGFLYSAPMALGGLVWLIAVTDLVLIRTEWPMLVLLFILQFLFERLDFFLLVEVTPGTYSVWQSSLGPVIIWSVVLILGPIALWLFVMWWLIWFAHTWQRSSSTGSRWHCMRNLAFNLACVTFASLIALTLYEHWAGNGVFPLPGLTLDAVLPVFFATIVWWLLSTLVWAPLFIYSGSSRGLTGTALKMYIRFWAITTGSHLLVDPFAILAAGLYTQNGLGVYLCFVAGLLLASFVAHQLSQAVERSQQRSRELEKLEQLGRAMITCCPDASTLPDVLKEHASNMFPYSQIEIHVDYGPLFPVQTLLHYPADWPLVGVSAWEWLRTTSEARYFMPGEALPWQEQPTGSAMVVAPILDVESTEPLGGIYLSRSRDPGAVGSLLPAVQSLAAQVASALNGAKVYAQTLAHQRVEQELALAWQIQASFLPDDLPHIPSWQLAATLKPARETAGDFYDFISLPNGRLGILVADVADKGMGAALYMALSRTLIRTYAVENKAQPELVLSAANGRILRDTRADLFVTVFYGILDPATGTLTYCNAGHNPPYLFRGQNGDPVQALRTTGIPLGMFEDMTWEQRIVQLAPGDLLVLYTDGITEAQNRQEEFFGEERLLEVVRANLGRSAQGLQDALMAQVREFVGDAPQFDDITLMVLVRDSTTAEIQ